MAGRRKNPEFFVLVTVLLALSVFIWLAQTMEGLNFDTIFIALFCTLMTGFIARCGVTLVTGR